MKKLLALFVVAAIAVGGYAHHHYWSSNSNTIKRHVQELAEGKNERIKVTFDSIETGGYPLRHEVVLKNPCIYFLGSSGEASLTVSDGCLTGDMTLSYSPFSSDKSIYIQTDGDLIVNVPQADGQSAAPIRVKGKLKQEYDFESGYLFAQSSDLAYVLENLRSASLHAKDLSIGTVEETPKGYIENLTGSFDYKRKAHGDNAQKLDLTLDYHTLLGDSLQAFPLPFEQFLGDMNNFIKTFNKNSGVNKARVDATIIMPKWGEIKRVFDKISSNTYEMDDFPDFSIIATQSNKNNYLNSSGKLDFAWVKEKDGSFKLRFKNNGIQDLTKEGEQGMVTLLQAIVQEVVKSMVASTTDKDAAIAKELEGREFDNLFKGLPKHMEVDFNVAVDKTRGTQQGDIYSVAVNPLSLGTDKGAVVVTLDYTNGKPMSAKVEFESLTRIVDGIITRYNIVADVLGHGKKIPIITERERDHLLAILQKYSDDPEKLHRDVTFSITEGDDGVVYIGKKQDIRGLVGEIGFFYHHLLQKVQPAEKVSKP